VWVSAEGTDPLNSDYLYELDRCESGSAND
jgi:hypothetical protein